MHCFSVYKKSNALTKMSYAFITGLRQIPSGTISNYPLHHSLADYLKKLLDHLQLQEALQEMPDVTSITDIRAPKISAPWEDQKNSFIGYIIVCYFLCLLNGHPISYCVLSNLCFSLCSMFFFCWMNRFRQSVFLMVAVAAVIYLVVYLIRMGWCCLQCCEACCCNGPRPVCECGCWNEKGPRTCCLITHVVIFWIITFWSMFVGAERQMELSDEDTLL